MTPAPAPARPRRPAVAAVELAIVLPVLLLVLLAVADLGRVARYRVTVAGAARAGCAAAAVRPHTPATQSLWENEVRAAVADDMADLPGFDAGALVVTATSTPDGTGWTRVSVTAAYPFVTVAEWPGLPHELTVSETAEMRLIRP